MRILIASDIHGRINAVRKLEKVIRAYDPDKIFLLGDFLYNGPRNGVPDDYDPMRTCDVLNKFASKIIGIRGNCDSRIDEELLRFKLEDGRVEHVNGFRCDLFHGDRVCSEVVKPQRGDLLIFGHTHVLQLRKEEGTLYLNPGSIGFPKESNPATFAVIDDRTIEIRTLDDGEVVKSMNL